MPLEPFQQETLRLWWTGNSGRNGLYILLSLATEKACQKQIYANKNTAQERGLASRLVVQGVVLLASYMIQALPLDNDVA